MIWIIIENLMATSRAKETTISNPRTFLLIQEQDMSHLATAEKSGTRPLFCWCVVTTTPLMSKDWRNQLAASQSTYEEFFPELNDTGPIFSYESSSSLSPTKPMTQKPISTKVQSSYQKLFIEHSFNLIESNEYLPSGRNISDPQRFSLGENFVQYVLISHWFVCP
jgi:hypothetical protein